MLLVQSSKNFDVVYIVAIAVWDLVGLGFKVWGLWNLLEAFSAKSRVQDLGLFRGFPT